MGRDSKTRKRRRKERRAQRRAEQVERLEKGDVLFPHSKEETRDPRKRWQGLTARGGLEGSFAGSGKQISVDFDDSLAEHALALSLTARPQDQNDN